MIKIIIYLCNKKTGEIIGTCQCNYLSPTTILNDLSDILMDKVEDVVSSEAVKELLSIRFWEYAIFYISILNSGIFIISIVYGIRLDNKDFISNLKNNLKSISSVTFISYY